MGQHDDAGDDANRSDDPRRNQGLAEQFRAKQHAQQHRQFADRGNVTQRCHRHGEQDESIGQGRQYSNGDNVAAIQAPLATEARTIGERLGL